MPHLRSGLLVAAMLAAPLFATPPCAAQTAPASTAPVPVVDPDAIRAVERMGKALRALPHFTLSADTITDYVLDDGQKVSLSGTVDYKVLGADRFFVEIRSEQQHRQLFYDGHALTIYSPRLKYYATLDGLDRSTQALLADSAAAYGVEFPLADLFLWGTAAFPTDRFQSALEVGTTRIDGDPTHHYAYRLPGVDWQVWVSDTTQLPRRLVITSHNDPALPDYQATLRWDTRRAVTAAELTFRPDGATRIVFVPVDADAQASTQGGE
ncbi:DUF2092 domain-containing protein [Stenotrophomonas sp. LGBM10]|uniref:DUF2092 domain-containing protein n=1 Tax=Stenotrophomonas sp. LGBM10 TaxID=3390038 RepID=UPI00398B598B